MPAHDSPEQHGSRQARRIRSELASTLLVARLDAGLAEQAAARAAGMSHAQWGRIERDALQDVSIGQACRACAAVGYAALHGRRAGCEAETRPRDMQALERRLALKARDGSVDVLILVVADTPGNRRLLDAHREVLRGLLPLDTRQVLGAFRRGELPERSGLVVL